MDFAYVVTALVAAGCLVYTRDRIFTREGLQTTSVCFAIMALGRPARPSNRSLS